MSKILGVFVLFCVFFTSSAIQDESALHEIFDLLGVLCVFICALGRLYTTAFLGGRKNTDLVTYGPFSIVRNPLYFFSLVGFFGVALMTNHIVLFALVPLCFIILYHYLIAREEVHLQEVFGEPYQGYCQRVPRLLPRLSLWNAPENIVIDVKLFNNGLKDAIWWFAAFPLVELAEYVHQEQWIQPLIFLP